MKRYYWPLGWKMAADWLLLGVEAERNRSVAFTGHQDYDGSADGILRAAVYRLWSEGFRFFLSGCLCKALHNMPYVH